MLWIDIESRYVNAALFILVDVLTLWAIHRGLRALQSLHHFSLATRGQHIPLARSRITIVAGELQCGHAILPSAFVVANAAALVLAFVATLGVNGEPRTEWHTVKRQHLTRVVTGVYRHRTNLSLIDRLGGGWKDLVLSCTRQTASRIEYWPVAFDRDANGTIWSSALCLKETPLLRPLLNASCVIPTDQSNCRLGERDRRGGKTDTNTVMLKPGKNPRADAFVIQALLSSGKKTGAPFPAVGDTVVLVDGIGEQGKMCLVIRHAGVTAPSYMATCTFSKVSNSTNITNLFVTLPVLRFGSSLSADEFLYMEILRYIRRGDLPSISLVSSRDLLQDYLDVALRLEEARDRAQQPKSVNGTQVKTFAIVIIALLLAIGLVLLPMKDVLSFFLVSKGGHLATELFCSDYDRLSKMLRAEMEKNADTIQSGKHSELRTFIDRHGTTRVGPCIDETRNGPVSSDRV